MNPATDTLVLVEYDRPIDVNDLLNQESGIYNLIVTPGDIVVTDDNSNTGYYDYNNAVTYVVKSFFDGASYLSETISLNDCRATDSSFYYDVATTRLSVHLENFDPPTNPGMFFGVATGFTKGNSDSDNYFNNVYYDPILLSVPDLSKEKDPLYYGRFKYQSVKISVNNTSGIMDKWRQENNFFQPGRVLVGGPDTSYLNFVQRFSGYIENDSRTWTNFSFTIQDQRKGFFRPVAINNITQSAFPFLDDKNNDKPRPVAYGPISKAGAICLNETEVAPVEYEYLIADTEFNFIDSLDNVYVAGTVKTPASVDLIAGTFQMTAADVAGELDNVKIDFTVDIKNGVAIIKKLIGDYQKLPFVPSFWDIAEINAAEIQSRNTSLYIDDKTKISDALEKICFDIDGYLFPLDSGVFTVRIYDKTRVPVRTIAESEWLGEPVAPNNGSEFLTSAVVEYKEDQSENKFLRAENKDFESVAFQRYKEYKVKSFKTGLTTEADALDKGKTIMEFSSNVVDIISRDVSWLHSDLEMMDFIIGHPDKRVSETEVLKVFEILGIGKNIDTKRVSLKLREVVGVIPDIFIESTLVDDLGGLITDNTGIPITFKQRAP